MLSIEIVLFTTKLYIDGNLSLYGFAFDEALTKLFGIKGFRYQNLLRRSLRICLCNWFWIICEKHNFSEQTLYTGSIVIYGSTPCEGH